MDFEIRDTIVIVRLSGYLGDESGALFLAEAKKYIDKGFTQFVFNLQNVPVINSLGLSNLLTLALEIVDYNDGDFALCNCSKLIESALRMTGIGSLGSFCLTEAEAIAAVSN